MNVINDAFTVDGIYYKLKQILKATCAEMLIPSYKIAVFTETLK